MQEKVKNWGIRAIAFFWSFLLTGLFQYALDRLYPFWSSETSLSFFAYTFIFTLWLAYVLYSYRSGVNPWFRYGVLAAAVLNAGLFFIMFILIGETGYLYRYPFLFTLQIFVQFFIFSTKLRIIISHRLSLALGFISGFGVMILLDGTNALVAIGGSALLFFIPARLFKNEPEASPPGINAMLPLRRTLDLIRYLLLGFSFLGIFDEFRPRFYLVTTLIMIGPIMQFVIFKIDQRKHHIKYGIIALGVIFLAIAAGYATLPFSFWCAGGYTLLTIWDSLYFKKRIEGRLRREQLIAGATLLLAMAAYFVTYDWALIFLGAILFGAQARILLYFFKGYRKVISAIFLLSLSAWAIVTYQRYEGSFKREFFSELGHKEIPPPAPLGWLIHFKGTNAIHTNLYPPKVLEKLKPLPGVAPFVHHEVSAVFLTSTLNSTAESNIFHLVDLSLHRAYRAPEGKQAIMTMIKKGKIKNLGVYDHTTKNSYHGIMTTESLPSPFTPDERQKEYLQRAAFLLADWYISHRHYRYAREVLLEAAEWTKDRKLYTKIAELSGVLGESETQVEFLEKAALGPFQKEYIPELKLLMELYFYNGRLKDSEKMAKLLAARDPDQLFTYLEWSFKVLKEKGNHWDYERFYRQVRRTPATDDPLIRARKEALLLDIRETIKANPLYFDIIQKEKKRQENIEFPE